MPAPVLPPARERSAGARALRVVLLGLAGSGKSTLSAELSSAAENQKSPFGAAWTVVEGDAVDDLIAGGHPLESDLPSLAAKALAAAALVLVLDASGEPERFEIELTGFAHFLRWLRRYQGEHNAVGGLPVFVNLTKCDLLARPDDSAVTWMELIEQRKREVSTRLQEFAAPDRGMEPMPFGALDLRVWASASAQPRMAEASACPGQPYGVVELFRQCLGAALAFRNRRRRASRLLAWTTFGAGGTILAMMLLIAALIRARPAARAAALAARLATYRLHEGRTPAERLREPLPPRTRELRAISADPDFEFLPSEDQDYVVSRAQELEAYAAYKARLEEARPLEARSGDALVRLEGRLEHGELAPPGGYADEWSGTQASERHLRLLRQVAALRLGDARATDWYAAHIAQADDLWTFAGGKPVGPSGWSAWQVEANTLATQEFPHPAATTLPDADGLTYATVERLDDVKESRDEWDVVRDRLLVLEQLTRALGLAGDRLPDGQRQPLDIPEHPDAAHAAGYLEALDRYYPRLRRESSGGPLPDAVADEIRRAARTAYERLLEAGRAVVLARLRQAMPDGRETVAAWAALRVWLEAPRALEEWRVLAVLLARLHDPEAPDPVTALSRFLTAEQFDIDVQGLTLSLPERSALRPAGLLTIYHARALARERTAADVLRVADGEGKRDAERRVVEYTLVRENGGPFVYRPGDGFRANLPVHRDGMTGEWVLTWLASGSDMYQFEALGRPPRLHAKAQAAAAGELLPDVRVAVTPENGVPRLPDLMPALRGG
jgi:hypothetical protein